MHNPSVPETLEGWCVLHQIFRVKWSDVRQLSEGERQDLGEQAVAALRSPGAGEGATALVAMLGHKGDLMLIHFRRTFDALSAVQLRLAQTPFFDMLAPAASYVSIVELGMYEMTAKIHDQLTEKGLQHGTDDYRAAQKEAMQVQQGRVASRLWAAFPARRYVCFYPMDKRRGEIKNWYSAPFEKRALMMREHGHIGRLYAGDVTQIISGSIGFDDWEWGVDLFAEDPLVFKKIIYEMRFDRASAEFAEFGPFYVGLQFSQDQLPAFLRGQLPTP